MPDGSFLAPHGPVQLVDIDAACVQGPLLRIFTRGRQLQHQITEPELQSAFTFAPGFDFQSADRLFDGCQVLLPGGPGLAAGFGVRDGVRVSAHLVLSEFVSWTAPAVLHGNGSGPKKNRPFPVSVSKQMLNAFSP